MSSPASGLLLQGERRDEKPFVPLIGRGEVRMGGPRVGLALLLSSLYGLAMGLFAPLHGASPWLPQLVSSVLKVPILLVVTFALTWPMFLAAVRGGGVRLSPGGATRLCLATFGVLAATLGMLAPVAALVSAVCNYSFATMINLGLFGVAGLAAVASLLRTVARLSRSSLLASPRRAFAALGAWCFALAAIGPEVGWRLRPLIGWRDTPFGWFRADSMTLWQGILSEIHNIVTVGGV